MVLFVILPQCENQSKPHSSFYKHLHWRFTPSGVMLATTAAADDDDDATAIGQKSCDLYPRRVMAMVMVMVMQHLDRPTAAA